MGVHAADWYRANHGPGSVLIGVVLDQEQVKVGWGARRRATGSGSSKPAPSQQIKVRLGGVWLGLVRLGGVRHGWVGGLIHG